MRLTKKDLRELEDMLGIAQQHMIDLQRKHAATLRQSVNLGRIIETEISKVADWRDRIRAELAP